MTLTTPIYDHERALAAGFDILEGGPITRWARPDSAQITRYFRTGGSYYMAWRSDGAEALVYTMAEAVAWAGEPYALDIEWHESREG